MSGVRQVVGLVVTSLLSSPLMMLQMAALQLVSLDTQGMPSIRSLVAVLIIYIGVIGHSWGNRKMERRSGSECFCFQATSHFSSCFSKSLSSWTVMVFLEWYYLLLVANALASDPAAHINTGIHQQRGDCEVRAADLSGHMRQVYLCEKSHSQVHGTHYVEFDHFFMKKLPRHILYLASKTILNST